MTGETIEVQLLWLENCISEPFKEMFGHLMKWISCGTPRNWPGDLT